MTWQPKASCTSSLPWTSPVLRTNEEPSQRSTAKYNLLLRALAIQRLQLCVTCLCSSLTTCKQTECTHACSFAVGLKCKNGFRQVLRRQSLFILNRWKCVLTFISRDRPFFLNWFLACSGPENKLNRWVKRLDWLQKVEFWTFTNYTDFCLSLLNIFEYQNLSQKEISIFVRIFASKDFLPLLKNS